jgi:hypothetical protein
MIEFAWRRSLTVLLFAGFLVCTQISARAAEPTAASDTLDEVLVTGERPGPGMWRVSRGDHDLWILATLVPLPKKMVWRSRAVEERIAASQALITPPEFTPDIGFFRGMMLLPSLLQARHSPDGKTLEEELPHDLWIRWLALRVKYLDHSDEKIRPVIAAFDLYLHAVDQVGLTDDDDQVWGVVRRIADVHHVPTIHVDLKVPLKDPKGDIRQLKEISREAEVGCLEKTMQRIETDLPSMVRRANLWSLGDIDGLRAMPFPNEAVACRNAFLSVPEFEAQASQIETSMNTMWLNAVDSALENNVSSFAVLPIRELFEADGLLAKLRIKGYTVLEPQAEQKP